MRVAIIYRRRRGGLVCERDARLSLFASPCFPLSREASPFVQGEMRAPAALTLCSMLAMSLLGAVAYATSSLFAYRTNACRALCDAHCTRVALHIACVTTVGPLNARAPTEHALSSTGPFGPFAADPHQSWTLWVEPRNGQRRCRARRLCSPAPFARRIVWSRCGASGARRLPLGAGCGCGGQRCFERRGYCRSTDTKGSRQ